MGSNKKMVYVGVPCVDCGRPLEWLELWNDKGVCQPCFHQRNLATKRAEEAAIAAREAINAALKDGHHAGDAPSNGETWPKPRLEFDVPSMAERAQAIRNRDTVMNGVPVEVHDSSKQAAGKANGRKHGHYFKDVENLKQIDVYMVFRLFETQDHEIEHAIKKLLAAGRRGYKDRRKDVLEAIDTLNRWVEIEDELSQTNGGQ